MMSKQERFETTEKSCPSRVSVHKSPKGTATIIIPYSFLCPNWLSRSGNGQPQTSFLMVFSVRIDSWSPGKDSHKLHSLWFSLSELFLEIRKGQPQTSFLIVFSVWIVSRSRERTATNFISRRFLCLDYPLKLEKDNHKYRILQSSLYDVPFRYRNGDHKPQNGFLSLFSGPHVLFFSCQFTTLALHSRTELKKGAI